MNKLEEQMMAIQDISSKELVRDQKNKTNYQDNLKTMLEQIQDIHYILRNASDIDKSDRLKDMEINTLRYITEHFMERIQIMELLSDR